jgi:hypothetical protein
MPGSPKTEREKTLEKAVKDLLARFDKISALCEKGIDGDQEAALEAIYKKIPDHNWGKKYQKIWR